MRLSTRLIKQFKPHKPYTDADVAFLREDEHGKRYTVYGAVCYESWTQWCETDTPSGGILWDNLKDIEKWRKGIKGGKDNERRAPLLLQ